MAIDPGGGWRSVAASVRNLPLAGVAVSLGYRRDGLDRSCWKRPGSVLSLNGAKFFDHLAGSGGGGAIDLVMHARCCGFRDAVSYLAGRGFAAPVVEDGSGGRAEGDCRAAFRLPERADFFWPRMRDWLAAERGLDGCLLNRCWRRGNGARCSASTVARKSRCCAASCGLSAPMNKRLGRGRGR